MSAMVSQITGASIVYSTVCSGADQRKHQSSALLAFVRGIRRWPVNSSHKGPVTRKMFPFDDVITITNCRSWSSNVRIPLAPTTKIRMARVTLSFDLLTGKWSPPWFIFVPQMNLIHEMGDVTAGVGWRWGLGLGWGLGWGFNWNLFLNGKVIISRFQSLQKEQGTS